MPPAKRIRLSKREPTPPFSHSEEESGSEDDDWAAERAARSGGQQAGIVQEDEEDEEDDEDDEEDGVAQFEDDDEELDYSSDEDEEASLGKQLASIPFASLLKAKKKLSASAHASTPAAADQDAQKTSYGASLGRRGRDNARDGFGGPIQGKRANGSLLKADRASKHAPMEMSSKRAVGRSRTIIETRADKSRDPRFDTLSGTFKPDLFQTSYSFLSDARTAELAALRKTAVLARKSLVLPEEEKEAIENALTKMESKEVSRRTKDREGAAMREWKKEENKKRESGKKEFYLKKTDQKAVFLKAKYDTLSTDKKSLRKAVEKKRRKTDQKDKKLLPNQRPRV